MSDLNLEEIDYLVHHITKDNRGKAKLWGPELGLSQVSLTNKTNPNITDTHLTPTELLHLMWVSKDFRVLDAFVRQLSPVKGQAVPLLKAMMIADKEHGDFSNLFIEADEDGRISPSEEARGLKEIYEEIEALKQKAESFKAYARQSRGEE